MKHYALTLVLLFSTLLSSAQEISGNWQGAIAAGGKNIRLIFHIAKEANGYSAKMDSPDQNAFGLPASSTIVTGDSIQISIKLIKGEYKGKWNGADEMEGNLIQGPVNMPLKLNRMSAAETSAAPTAAKPKPQTPQAPFPYISEEVSYQHSSEKITLAGTFTKPSAGSKFPVVLLITGSGPQDRDETIGMHKSFAVFADYLTRQGIAVLRVDDRGVGKSTGNFAQSNSADFATDVLSGIAYLKTRPDVDITKIGLMGHSEGGFIAPYVAARSKDIAFIVMLAGPAVGGLETMHFQAVEKPLATLSKHDRDAYRQLYDLMTKIALDTATANHLDTYVRNSYKSWKQQQPDSTLKNLVHGTDEEVISTFIKGFADFKRPWWKFFLSYDLSKDLQKLRIPVLALNGEKDEQVDAKANLAKIKTILTKNKNPDFQTLEVPGVNHLFQHCKECGNVSEYLSLEETFDTATLTLIGNWIKKQVQ